MINRLGIPISFAFLVTVGLFTLMHLLISANQVDLRVVENIPITQIVRVNEPPEVIEVDRTPVEPPKPQTPPPIKRPSMTSETGPGIVFAVVPPLAPVGTDDGFGRSDGSLLPLIKVQPTYPRRAQAQGLSGWVLVAFTVTVNGTVRDPYVMLNCAQSSDIDGTRCSESPSSVFNQAALSAVKKFKYMPKVLNGETVESLDVQNKITFSLSEA